MPKTRPTQPIVVAGDATVDWYSVAVPPEQSPQGGASDERLNWQRSAGTRFVVRPGGALLQADLVAAATGRPVLTHARDVAFDSRCLRSHVDLALMPAHRQQEKKGQVYRVQRWGGFSLPLTGLPKPRPVEKDNALAPIVVLDDAGNGFRDTPAAWPTALRHPKNKPWIVLKMHAPLFRGRLWEHLIKEHSERLIVVLRPGDLRAAGVNLGRGLSWERTAMDFVWHMYAHPMLPRLARCAHVVVMFGLDGAIDYQPGASSPTTLYYDPASIEDGYAETIPGRMVGATSALVAGMVSELAKGSRASLGEGIGRGLHAARRLLRQGFGTDPNQFDPFVATLFRAPEMGEASFESVAVPTDENTRNDPESWSILREKADNGFEEMAYHLVREGHDKALRGIPLGCFGKFRTVDRMEIEGFRAVRNLLTEYVHDKSARVPLSIAVFGPPGSGKSFGVNEVAKAVGGQDVEKMEFNVSQFRSSEDLVRALHRVRDRVLEGKIPLVFFDEFDSSFGGDALGWLKFFLAPMQDGKFRDGDAEHPIGKSIFVFAGGTRTTFRDFARLAEACSKVEKDEFIERKGPDFVSRLRGTIDIAELNPTDSTGNGVYMLRRALLLRSLIELKPRCKSMIEENRRAHSTDVDKIVHIDPGVLRAFIKAPVFKHRARSMEAIIDMSLLAGRSSFEQASLPPRDQLTLHVDAATFLRLVARDVLLGSVREQLGRAAHEQFLENQKNKRPADAPEMQPWDTLREDLKESNRQQADDIPNKLRAVGCGFEASPAGKEPELFTFTRSELNQMARREHERWNQERRFAGWKFGPKKDIAAKITPYLIPFDRLPAEVKKWDLDAVYAIPVLVKRAGFNIYRLRATDRAVR